MDQHEHRETRSGSGAQAAEWDARYSEHDGARWSGRPNGRLLAEVADLTPGRALDVGCGEGADAIWLARSGWTVTAIEISEVALTRARVIFATGGMDSLPSPLPTALRELIRYVRPPCLRRWVRNGYGWVQPRLSPVARSALVGPGGDPAVLDELYGRVQARLLAEPERYLFRYTMTAVLLTRR